MASVGFGLILFALAMVCLVLFAKEQFGWLVGSRFLGSVVALVLGGALLMIVAVLMLPAERKHWMGWAVLVWALIAITSPLFGFMFLLPWGVLFFSAPLILVVLVLWFREGRGAIGAAPLEP